MRKIVDSLAIGIVAISVFGQFVFLGEANAAEYFSEDSFRAKRRGSDRLLYILDCQRRALEKIKKLASPNNSSTQCLSSEEIFHKLDEICDDNDSLANLLSSENYDQYNISDFFEEIMRTDYEISTIPNLFLFEYKCMSLDEYASRAQRIPFNSELLKEIMPLIDKIRELGMFDYARIARETDFVYGIDSLLVERHIYSMMRAIILTIMWIMCRELGGLVELTQTNQRN